MVISKAAASAVLAAVLVGDALAAASDRPAFNLTGICQGAITFAGAGTTVYVGGGGGTLSGGSLSLPHNSGFTLMSGCNTNWRPEDFWEVHLLGKTLSFDVNLASVGCACNLAVYTTQMPAKDESGNPSVGTCTWSPYYCDANKVCGQWCPEMDIMEANNHAFKVTPHTCDSPSSTGHYYNCDGVGVGPNTKSTSGAYGPGSGYTIDTTRTFTVHTSFDTAEQVAAEQVVAEEALRAGAGFAVEHEGSSVLTDSEASGASAASAASQTNLRGAEALPTKTCSARGGCTCDCSWATSCSNDDGSCCWGCCCGASPSPSSLARIRTVFQQGTKTFTMSNTDSGYLSRFAGSLAKGHAIRITYWGDSAGTMSWLDSGVCGSESCTGGTATLSNFRLA